jgi:protein gp37
MTSRPEPDPGRCCEKIRAMAKDSAIEWTDHTFNPWWGCEKVSPACTNCYAETWAKRLGKDLWGRQSPRRFFSDDHWNEPLRWNRQATAASERRRVFCASMGDVFESRGELDEARRRLWRLVESTPSLDWLLLTKRPENVLEMTPWNEDWPANVWIGTTAEDQRYYDLRAAHLATIPAKVLFLSCEPLLGPITLSPDVRVDWVIVGGESGARARPMTPAWARSLREQCELIGAAFFFKQWGEWGPRNREDHSLSRLGKKNAGRTLDGSTWDQFPDLGHSVLDFRAGV